VTYTALAFPAMLPALANKSIDAAFEIEPYLTIPAQQGTSVTVAPIGDLAPGSVAGALLISPVFAHDQSEAARRFVLATLQGVRDYYRAINQGLGGREAIVQILIKDTNLKDPALYDSLGMPLYAPNGDFDPATMDQFQDFLIGSGTMQERVPLERWYDRSYLDDAFGVLGRS
jgi:NitT/TauT family transport system substrate-binding protein